MTKEDFVDEIFINSVDIALFVLPFKKKLVNVDDDSEERKAAIKHLKMLCSNINFLLNGLRSEKDFLRYSKGYEESMKSWFSFLKNTEFKDSDDKFISYKNKIKNIISLIENGK